MKKLLLLIIVSFALAGAASAATVWNPVTHVPPIVPPDIGLWSDGGNWTGGATPTSTDKCVFNVPNAAKCYVYGDQVHGQLVMGDGGSNTDPEENFVRLLPYSTLTSGSRSWNAVGYNHPAVMIIEYGATWDCTTDHFWLGMHTGSEGSKLVINGGTLTNQDGAFQLGRNGTGGIDITLNAGLIDVLRDAEGDIIRGDNSSIDILFGTLTVDRNLRDEMEAEVAKGYLTAFGEQGDDGSGPEIVIVQAGGRTTVTATGPDPLGRTPTYDAVTDHGTDLDLTWINLPSNTSKGVWVDVYFGTDPSMDPNGDYDVDFEKIVDKGKDVTTAKYDTAGIEITETYFYQIDTYPGDPATDPNAPVSGFPIRFTATDDKPPTDVNAGVDMVSWIGNPVELYGTYNDDGTTPVTEIWTSSDASVTFSPSNDGGVTGAGKNVTATGSANVTATLTFSADDDTNPPVTDDMILYVFDDACQAARDGDDRDATYPMDLAPATRDCEINYPDFAELASEWLTNYTLTGPVED